MESALRPHYPPPPNRPSGPDPSSGPEQPSLDQVVRPKHHRCDPRKRTQGGRHQIGIPAGFRSESVAGFLLECVAGFVGIRSRKLVYSPLEAHADWLLAFIERHSDATLAEIVAAISEERGLSITDSSIVQAARLEL